MTLKQIRTIIENETELDISTPCRKQETVLARAIYCLIARELTDKTLKEVGKEINRKHDSILHLVNKSKNFVKTEKDYKKLYSDVLSIISSIPEENIMVEEKVIVVEKIIYRDINKELRHYEKDILKDLKVISDEDLLEFRETRLKPFLGMLKSRKVHGVEVIHGARRNFTLKQC